MFSDVSRSFVHTNYYYYFKIFLCKFYENYFFAFFATKLSRKSPVISWDGQLGNKKEALCKFKLSEQVLLSCKYSRLYALCRTEEWYLPECIRKKHRHYIHHGVRCHKLQFSLVFVFFGEAKIERRFVVFSEVSIFFIHANYLKKYFYGSDFLAYATYTRGPTYSKSYSPTTRRYLLGSSWYCYLWKNTKFAQDIIQPVCLPLYENRNEICTSGRMLSIRMMTVLIHYALQDVRRLLRPAWSSEPFPIYHI